MFNHYAKLKRIIEAYPDFKIIQIDEPTTTKRFDGQLNYYDHYYRLVTVDGSYIKYGKFQKLDKLAQVLGVSIESLEARIIT